MPFLFLQLHPGVQGLKGGAYEYHRPQKKKKTTCEGKNKSKQNKKANFSQRQRARGATQTLNGRRRGVGEAEGVKYALWTDGHVDSICCRSKAQGGVLCARVSVEKVS